MNIFTQTDIHKKEFSPIPARRSHFWITAIATFTVVATIRQSGIGHE